VELLSDLWIPLLSNSVLYKRGVGYFRSNYLSSAVNGLIKFIEHKGEAMMVCGIEFTKEDIESIANGYMQREKIIEERLLISINDCKSLRDKSSLKILAWMVKNGNLDIKIAVRKDHGSGIFHPKFGLCYDEKGNIVTFEGSANETGGGLLSNRESVSIDTSWNKDPWALERINAIEKDFDRLWNNKDNEYDVIEFPEAAKQLILKIAPSEMPKKEPLMALSTLTEDKSINKIILLRDYQKKAVKAWLSAGGIGMFEMATGSGKTYTAISCVRELEETLNSKGLCVVVTCPYTHLVKQWQKSLNHMGYSSVFAFGDSAEWRKKVENILLDLNDGVTNRVIIVTTHDTFSSDYFIWMIKQIRKPMLLIADEVHAVGSEVRSQGLLENYQYRIGLSATPKRYFDEEGTNFLYSYFGKAVIEFTLADAIDEGHLVPYLYHPLYITLNDKEIEDYKKLTRKIAIEWSKTNDGLKKNDLLNLFQIQRQRIIVNAEGKLPKLKEILIPLIDRLDHCLIYCSDVQLNQVQSLLNKMGIIHQKITFREDVESRQNYLEKFEKGIYKVIVAINVLDEGLDIPSIKMAVMLASTGNPKQYIQRRGRILRPYPSKDNAELYDILVLSPINLDVDDGFLSVEKKIIMKELKRHEEMARTALNSEQALKSVESIKRKYSIEISK